MKKAGFTLIELLAAVLIIGILGAIALPQYQKAVLKSRYSGMMPIAKTLAEANEVYYAEHDRYANRQQDLNITVQAERPDGTELEFSTDPEYSYVLATNPGVQNNNYVVYQKHSENFPGNIHCEAVTGDTRAEELCQTLGGEYIGENGDYTAYLLAGSTAGSQFPKQCTTQPDDKQACSTCGYMTREAECNTKTGEWEYEGEFDPSTCPSQPDPEVGEACGTGYTGNLTRPATCSSDHTGWEYTGEWTRTACVEIPTCTGNQPADTKAACDKGYSGTKTGSYSCQSGEWVVTWNMSTCVETDGDTTYNQQYPNFNCSANATETCSGDNTFDNSAHCDANTEGSCIGNTYNYAGKCYGNAEYSCSGGMYPYRGTGAPTCEGTSDNSCSSNNTFYAGNCNGSGKNSCSENTFGKGYSGYLSTFCYGTGIDSCNNNNFISSNSYTSNQMVRCYGRKSGACNNNTFSGRQSSCHAEYAGSCLNNTYTNGAHCSGSFCPAGTPTGWMISNNQFVGISSCNSGTGTYGRQYCPAGMAYDNGGTNGATRCHNGSGGYGEQYCN